MKNYLIRRPMWHAVLATSVLLVAPLASAQVHIGIGVGGPVYGPPVVYAPPPPRYYAPPPPVIYGPPPVYYGRPYYGPHRGYYHHGYDHRGYYDHGRHW